MSFSDDALWSGRGFSPVLGRFGVAPLNEDNVEPRGVLASEGIFARGLGLLNSSGDGNDGSG